MFIKLNSGLQTKNILGLTAAELDGLISDTYYNYLRVPADEIEVSKNGQVITLELGIDLDINRDYGALIQPNPALHEYGTVSFNPIVFGKTKPTFTFKAFKAGSIVLDYLAEIRLVGK